MMPFLRNITRGSDANFSTVIQPTNEADPHLIPVAAGYTTKRTHLIDLRTLDTCDQLLTKTLSYMSAVRQDYAHCSKARYIDVFNWDTLAATLRDLAVQDGFTWPLQRRYHIIAFYSQLEPDMEAATEAKYLLYKLDEASFEEAMEGGGLLKYWFGKPDGSLRNLATCK